MNRRPTHCPVAAAKARAKTDLRPHAPADTYAEEQALRCAELRAHGHELTPLDLAALHTADELVLIHRKDRGTAIHASLLDHPPRTREYTDRQILTFPDAHLANRRERIIPAGGEVVDLAAGEHTPQLTTHTAVVRHEIHDHQLHCLWRTVLDLLRAGDVLHIRWHLSVSAALADDRGYHLDEVWLAVARRERVMTFALGWGLTPIDAATTAQGGPTVRTI